MNVIAVGVTVLVVGFLAVLVLGGFASAAEQKSWSARVGAALGTAIFAVAAIAYVASTF